MSNKIKDLSSYHVFLYPFKWRKESIDEELFSKRTSISDLVCKNGLWRNIATPESEEYKRELYNEKNYFYKFTHRALYDNDQVDNVVQHYERNEPIENEGKVLFKINVISGKSDCYVLKVRSISLNLYDTGVGTLLFYLENDNPSSGFDDILRINQFGRRVAPPFFDTETGIAGTKELELPDYISIAGLSGPEESYTENFVDYQPNDAYLNMPPRHIRQLMVDFSAKIKIESVIDDRMFVVAWAKNDGFSGELTENFNRFKNREEWFKYLFVDAGFATCQNDEMSRHLVDENTYARWQKWGTVYGCSRYSLVMLTNSTAPEFLLTHLRTIYTRMVELCLMQRASMLRFAEEIKDITQGEEDMSGGLFDGINSVYRSYLKFTNKMCFSEVTAQEQGIELYDMLQRNMRIPEHVRALNLQIEELHQYLNIIQNNANQKEAKNVAEETKRSAESTDKLTKIVVFASIAILLATLTLEHGNSVNEVVHDLFPRTLNIKYLYLANITNTFILTTITWFLTWFVILPGLGWRAKRK